MIGGQSGHAPPPRPFTAARSAGRKRPPAPWRLTDRSHDQQENQARTGSGWEGGRDRWWRRGGARERGPSQQEVTLGAFIKAAARLMNGGNISLVHSCWSKQAGLAHRRGDGPA